jgi:hypothetical protein
VPIPPDWDESGKTWQQQGPLTTKLILSGIPAVVWTYSDPAIRGACIALPRGNGAPGSAAGIICQSATTGKACFWDNKLRSDGPMAPPLGWSGLTLRIGDLRDGSNLSENCTSCHRGNNVFLLSPDDPTWAKVMGRPAPLSPTFTTRVATSPSDTSLGHPRYVPVSGQPGWSNVAPSPATGYCNSCHELPALTAAPAMPPRCATSPTSCNIDPP